MSHGRLKEPYYIQLLHGNVSSVGLHGLGLSKNDSLEADCLINISPDLPRDLDTYQFYYQLVIMDGDKLRERAAETWAQCKKLGLDTTFFESL